MGTPDDVLGEAVRAYVVRRMPGCPAFEGCISSFYKEHLPREINPKVIVTLDHLPRNSAGKVARTDLPSLNPCGPA